MEPPFVIHDAGSGRYGGTDGGPAAVVLRPRPSPRPQWRVLKVPGSSDGERRAEVVGGGDGGESSGNDGEGGAVSW